MENWTASIEIYKKSSTYKPDVIKVSTKHCHKCGNTSLLLFRTLNLKSCTDCYEDIPWYLEDGQQPIQ
jgi:protein-arginine kinase activator protein McsA